MLSSAKTMVTPPATPLIKQPEVAEADFITELVAALHSVLKTNRETYEEVEQPTGFAPLDRTAESGGHGKTRIEVSVQ